ncbi:MAG: dolichyl-phosphate beta-glucosyltransferase [bacterium]
MNVSLIIPAYNEEKRLGVFLESIVDYTSQRQQDIQEIMVVDDGSFDATVIVAEKFSSRLPLCVLKHSQNKGKGAAVQTGVMAASGSYIIFMDADGATPITELPKMTDALQQAQVAIGNRWMTGAQTRRHSLLRQLSGFTYRKYMSLFGLGQIDTMCGFKGYHQDIARKLFTSLIEERWLFDAEIAYKAVKAGYTIRNFPIKWESKDGSKLDTKTLIKTALQIWPLIRKIK